MDFFGSGSDPQWQSSESRIPGQTEMPDSRNPGKISYDLYDPICNKQDSCKHADYFHAPTGFTISQIPSAQKITATII